MDFSDEIVSELRELSPRLQIERHFPQRGARCDRADGSACIRPATFPEPEQAPKLRWIQMNTAGVNHAQSITRLCRLKTLSITSTSGIHASNMAQYCLMAMLMFNYQDAPGI